MPLARIAVGSRRLGATPAASPGHAAAFVATAIGLGYLMLPCARADDESAAAASDLTVTVVDGRLTVRLDETPLEAVLEAIAAQTDLRITIRGDPGMVRPQEFSDLPLEAGIRRLTGERGLMMVFARAGDRGEPERLQQVRVYGDQRSGAITRSRRPPTRTLGKEPTPATLERTPEPPSYQELAAKDKGERLVAIRGLARRKDDAALEALGALLAHDPDHTVRRIAATALSNIGDEAAAAALEAALSDSDTEVRIQAMRGLRVINGEAAAAPLSELALGDAEPELRRQAIHLLATLRSDEARSTVELAASDPDDAVRAAAEEVLNHPRRRR